MKAKSATFLLLVILIIAVMSGIALNGFTVGSFRVPSVKESIKPGLDIAGGSTITYEPKDAGISVNREQGDTVVQIMRTRLTAKGFTEANVTKSGDRKFIVEIPAVTNPEEAAKTLGETAQLKFVDPDGNIIVDGKDVASSKPEFKQIAENQPAENIVSITLKDEGLKKWAEATKRIAAQPEGKNHISIMMDETTISSPRVKEEINSKDFFIQGQFTAVSAKELSDKIRAGQLPFSLKEVAMSSVGATLGESALKVTVTAGAIAILLVILFIMGFYRLPGLVAGISLVGYTTLVALILGMFKINLTLPGMAGIILSIGMAVDANVIIFERIIDELKSGKTLMAAIDAGFHRALTAVIDSNVTTLIAAVVLIVLGTGTVVGFATTLLIGVLTSMFTAIVVTRFLLIQMVGLNVKHRWLYGIGVK